ncbi:Glycosyl transferases group 1 [Bhargavaea cecembensis DSE10]|uniref:Glycosyl transferases group 1 n=1 Tax=Bhargavaea cecembensis DSE10 TaxID=1235279 RepID=M7NY16_9BACL|nr:glycosyltransferase [Bhargavaea cecembensis]EMR06575.1 Glycosyl transferases group 1 [Bhargavaea cecembensis DSE10]
MKILVIAEDYSEVGRVSLHYIHSRNNWYKQSGIDVKVISFKAKQNYTYEDIQVYTFENFTENPDFFKSDILVSHAPNIKNHYKFIKKYHYLFSDIVFFFHGHEVLKTSEIYPQPYKYLKKKSQYHSIERKIYDYFKLKIWRSFFIKISHKSQFVFVSEWMLEMFYKYVKVPRETLAGRSHVIYNCVGETFEKESFESETQKFYDFITIRSNLDGSKYGIDIVRNLALNNPDYKFCVIGKGKFFEHNSKPDNLTLIKKNLSHSEIINYLNRSRSALIPTRVDSQGVMACEFATFGIPVITSDISICREVFLGFENVSFINNDNPKINLGTILERFPQIKEKNTKYFSEHTIEEEIKLFQEIIKR